MLPERRIAQLREEAEHWQRMALRMGSTNAILRSRLRDAQAELRPLQARIRSLESGEAGRYGLN
jgi:hypothetical protein